MAESVCPKCSATDNFELKKKAVGGKSDWEFIQCANCGTVINAVPYDFNRNMGKIIALLEKIAQKL